MNTKSFQMLDSKLLIYSDDMMDGIFKRMEDNIIIIYRGRDKNYERPKIGDRYVIHKSLMTTAIESPGWVSYMDKYDGCTIEITDEYRDERNYVDHIRWAAHPVDKQYIDPVYYFNINWLEKIDNFSDLDESTVNFFDF